MRVRGSGSVICNVCGLDLSYASSGAWNLSDTGFAIRNLL